MKKSQTTRRWMLAVACIALTCLVFALCIPPRQPSYNGHPLSYWLNELPISYAIEPSTSRGMGMWLTKFERMDMGGRHYGSQNEKPNDSISAIRQIGTKGLPFIISRIKRHQSPIKGWIQRCALKLGIKRALFAEPDIEVERGQALTALLALPTLPPDVVAELSKLSKSNTNSIGLSASYVIMANTNGELKSMATRYK
ncbi:MAG: hypothetical protein JWR26_619 [Pedosphaera sp.]|nr:hypothetical protein [Pedosphaera sp.]